HLGQGASWLGGKFNFKKPPNVNTVGPDDILGSKNDDTSSSSSGSSDSPGGGAPSPGPGSSLTVPPSTTSSAPGGGQNRPGSGSSQTGADGNGITTEVPGVDLDDLELNGPRPGAGHLDPGHLDTVPPKTSPGTNDNGQHADTGTPANGTPQNGTAPGSIRPGSTSTQGQGQGNNQDHNDTFDDADSVYDDDSLFDDSDTETDLDSVFDGNPGDSDTDSDTESLFGDDDAVTQTAGPGTDHTKGTPDPGDTSGTPLPTTGAPLPHVTSPTGSPAPAPGNASNANGTGAGTGGQSSGAPNSSSPSSSPTGGGTRPPAPVRTDGTAPDTDGTTDATGTDGATDLDEATDTPDTSGIDTTSGANDPGTTAGTDLKGGPIGNTPGDVTRTEGGDTGSPVDTTGTAPAPAPAPVATTGRGAPSTTGTGNGTPQDVHDKGKALDTSSDTDTSGRGTDTTSTTTAPDGPRGADVSDLDVSEARDQHIDAVRELKQATDDAARIRTRIDAGEGSSRDLDALDAAQQRVDRAEQHLHDSEDRLRDLGIDPNAPESFPHPAPVVARDDSQRQWIASQVTADDLPDGLPNGLDPHTTVTLRDLTAAGVAVGPALHTQLALNNGEVSLRDTGLDPVDQVKVLMNRPGPWPQSLDTVAADTSRRIWQDSYEDFTGSLPPGTDPRSAREAWDRATGLVLPLELHPVRADSRYTTGPFRDAVRQVADLLAGGSGRPAAITRADQLRTDLGLPFRVRGGAPESTATIDGPQPVPTTSNAPAPAVTTDPVAPPEVAPPAHATVPTVTAAAPAHVTNPVGPSNVPTVHLLSSPAPTGPLTSDSAPEPSAMSVDTHGDGATVAPHPDPHSVLPDPYRDLLVGAFGADIIQNPVYPQLRDATARLDSLRRGDGDVALRQGPLNLAAVARRVLLLDPTAQVGSNEYGQLFRIALDPATQQPRSLASLTAYGLVLRGALSQPHAITASDGTPYGRDWDGDPGDSHGLDFVLDTVWDHTGRPAGQRQTTNPHPAPWRPAPGRPRPYVIMADGGPHTVSVATSDNTRTDLPIDVFTELLALDPTLTALPPDVPVLLLVPEGGGRQLELPRALAHRINRQVWSTSGHPVPGVRSDRTVTLFLRKSPGLPDGDWIPSNPGEVPQDTDPRAADVPAWERNLVSFTLVAEGDNTMRLGRAAFHPSEFAGDREKHYRRLHLVKDLERLHPATYSGLGRKPLTVGAAPGERAHHVVLHGAPHIVAMPQQDGSVYKASGEEFTGWLKRRPSVRNLRDQDWIYLDACWTGGSYRSDGRAYHSGVALPSPPDPLAQIPIAQLAANGTRKRVRAGDRSVGYGFNDDPDLWMQVITDGQARGGQVTEYWPEPLETELADLARTAGLHNGPDPVPGHTLDTTLRLVRALRHTFGPGIGQDPSYPGLLRGIGALETMRGNDPHLRDFTPFTLDLFERVTRAHRQFHGGVPALDTDAYRAVLAWATGAPPGTRLTDAVHIPVLTQVAQQLRSLPDLASTAASVLPLAPSATVGPAEVSWLYWTNVKASEWIDSVPDIGAAAMAVMHLPAPDPHAPVGMLVARAIAAGRDPYNPVQLAAFHLEEVGALGYQSLTYDSSGLPNGRNWRTPVPPGERVDLSTVHTLAQRPDGTYDNLGQETAPWIGQGNQAYVVSAEDAGADHVRITVPGGRQFVVPYVEVAELLANDPHLNELNPETTDVALDMSYSGGDTAQPHTPPPLQPAIARSTGRTVWAPKGASMVARIGSNGPYALAGLPAVTGTTAAADWVAAPSPYSVPTQSPGAGSIAPNPLGSEPSTSSGIRSTFSPDTAPDGPRPAPTTSNGSDPTPSTGRPLTVGGDPQAPGDPYESYDATYTGVSPETADWADDVLTDLVGEQPDLDALARRLLHLDFGAPTDAATIDQLYELVVAADGAGRATSLAAIGAFDLDRRGALDDQWLVRDTGGRRVGRDWTGSAGRPRVDRYLKVSPSGRVTRVDAPWPQQRQWIVSAEGGPEGPWLKDRDGNALVPHGWEEFAELLRHDPAWQQRGDLVIAVSQAGSQALEGPALVSDVLEVRTWSTHGTVDWGGRTTSGDPLMRVGGTAIVWVSNRPGQRTRAVPGGVTDIHGTRIDDREIASTTMALPNGQTSYGRSMMQPGDPVRAKQGRLDGKIRHFAYAEVREGPNGESTIVRESALHPLPFDPAYVMSFHGTSMGGQVPTTDDDVTYASLGEIAGFFGRRGSFRRLRPRDMVLAEACEVSDYPPGTNDPLHFPRGIQHISNRVDQPIVAVNKTIFATPARDGKPDRYLLETADIGNPVDVSWHYAYPEPSHDALLEIGERISGRLQQTPTPEQLLSWLRAAREIYGPDFGPDSPGFDPTMQALGTIDAQRPDAGGTGTLTLPWLREFSQPYNQAYGYPEDSWNGLRWLIHSMSNTNTGGDPQAPTDTSDTNPDLTIPATTPRPDGGLDALPPPGVPYGVDNSVATSVLERGGQDWWRARAAAGDPVLRQHTWTSVNRQTPDMNGVLQPTTVHGTFRVRRFTHNDVNYTDIEVRTALTTRDPLTAQQLADLWTELSADIDAVYNTPGHKLPNGDILHVTPVRVAHGDPDTDWLADVYTPAPGKRPSHHRIPVNLRAGSRIGAHEFGHQVGLPDEYTDKSTSKDIEPVQGINISGSLMGRYNEPIDAAELETYEREAAEGRPTLTGDGMAQGGLRDRNLGRIARFVGDLPTSTPRITPLPTGLPDDALTGLTDFHATVDRALQTIPTTSGITDDALDAYSDFNNLLETTLRIAQVEAGLDTPPLTVTTVGGDPQAPVDTYEDHLIQIFGPGVTQLPGYQDLHDALARLDTLRGTDSDPALRQGPLDLDAVTRRVLLLDPAAPIGATQYRDLFRLAQDPAMVRAPRLATLAALGLAGRGALSEPRGITAPDGTPYGREWLDDPGASHGLDLDLDNVWDHTGQPITQPQTTGPRPAPWRPAAGRPRPFVVAAGGSPHSVTVVTSDGARTSVPADVFIELLAMDPTLSGLPQDVPVLLLVPYAGGRQLDLPRALADRLGRNVWSTSGYPAQDGLSDSTTRIFLFERPGTPRGDWILSTPGEVLSETETTQTADVPAWERNLVSFTLVADGDNTQQLGRAAFHPGEFAGLREPRYRNLHRVTLVEHQHPAFPRALATVPLTVGAKPGERVYHLAMHGSPRHVMAPQEDGSTYEATGQELTGWLKRRPSMRRLRDQDWIYLDACWTGGAHPGTAFTNAGAPLPPTADPLADTPLAQVVANGMRKRVRAGERPIGYVGSPPDVRLLTPTDVGQRPGKVLEFWPEPRDTELADLARTAGLHNGPDAVPGHTLDTTLRLVRALRHTFGPGIGEDPSYHDLLRGIGALETMRSNDPHLASVTPFTLDLFRRAAFADLRARGGNTPSVDTAAFRALLARAAGAPEGTRLSDFVQIPGLTWVAQQLTSMPNLQAAAVRVLGLEPSAALGPAELARLYWARVKALEYLASVRDPGAAAAAALHLPAPDPTKRDQLGWLATTAIAAGRDPYAPHQLAAFHLQQLGAFAPGSLTHDPSGRANGRNWAGTLPPGGQVDLSTVSVLRPGGSYRNGGQEPAPWTARDKKGFVVRAVDAGAGRTWIALPGGRLRVPHAEVAALLAHDPDLLSENLQDTQVVLAVSQAGSGTPASGTAQSPAPLSLRGAVARSTGRTVWAPSGTVDLNRPGNRGDFSLSGIPAAGGTAAADWVRTPPVPAVPNQPATATPTTPIPTDSDAAASLNLPPSPQTGAGPDPLPDPATPSQDIYHDHLVRAFGADITQDLRYHDLHDALARLDTLRGTDSDPALRQGPLDLDAVTRRVLVLPPGTPLSTGHYDALFRFTTAPDAAQAPSLAAIAAVGLVMRGAMSTWMAVKTPDDTPYGRDWGSSLGADRSLDMDLDSVWQDNGAPSWESRTTDPRPAPWRPAAGKPRPYVIKTGGSPYALTVTTLDGATTSVPVDVFAELLALDPALTALPPDVPVVLLVPHAGGRQLELPRALAHRLDRPVWSTSGNPETQKADDGKVRVFLEKRTGLPVGDWITSRPGEVMSDPTTQTTDVPAWERNMVSYTVVADDDPTLQIGRAAFHPQDFSTRESIYRTIHRARLYARFYPAIRKETAPTPLTVGAAPGERVHHVLMHGAPDAVSVPQQDGSTYRASGEEITGWLKRRPSVKRLRDQDWIDFDLCFTGGAYRPGAARLIGSNVALPPATDPLAQPPLAQIVANGTRKRVRAADRVSAYAVNPSTGVPRFLLHADARGNDSRALEFWPEPLDAELADLARTAGLHTGPDPVPGHTLDTTLRLVRALRHAFGPGIGPGFRQDPTYPDLLHGIGALEKMRDNDPHLRDITPFTLELFTRAARADRRDHGDGRDVLDADTYRGLLTRAATAPPNTSLSDFVQIPLSVRAADQLRNLPHVAALATQLLRLPPSAPVGAAEMTRLYWAYVEAAEWIQSVPDIGATAAAALHLPAPDPALQGRLVELATAVIAAGLNPRNPAELGAFDLVLRGALGDHSLYFDPSGRPVGRNWSAPQPGHVVDSSAVLTATRQPQGTYGLTGSAQAPWVDQGKHGFVVSAQNAGPDRVRIALPGMPPVDVTNAEVAELLALDPALAVRDLRTTQVVLAVHGSGGSTAPATGMPPVPPSIDASLPLRFAVALSTGRTVWAPQGRLQVAPLPNSGHSSLTGIFDTPGTTAAADFVPTSPDFWIPAAAVSAAPLAPTHSDGSVTSQPPSQPQDPYRDHLVRSFGTDIVQSPRYQQLHDAVGRLDTLRANDSDPALRQGPLDLDAVTRRVLVLDAATPLTTEHYDMALLFAGAPDAAQASGLATIAAIGLAMRGALSGGLALTSPDGTRYGRDWGSVAAADRTVDLDLDSVWQDNGAQSGGSRTTDPRPAPWRPAAGKPRPYVIRTGGSPYALTVTTPNDDRMTVPVDVFAELLALDPALTALPPDVPVVLMVPHAGGRQLELPRALAHRLDRPVWSTSGNPDTQKADDGKVRIFLEKRTGLPVGDWILSRPGEVMSDPTTTTDVPAWERNMVSYTVVAEDDPTRQIGRAALSPSDFATREATYRKLNQDYLLHHYVSSARAVKQGVRPRVGAAPGEPVHHVFMHGTPEYVQVPQKDGSVYPASGEEITGWLKRRPSVSRLGDRGWINFDACWTGGAYRHGAYKRTHSDAPLPRAVDPLTTIPLSQVVANGTRKRVRAGDRVNGYDLDPDTGKPRWFVFDDVRGGLAHTVEYYPEPLDTELADLARTAGLHTGPDPVPGHTLDTTLRLVRALRQTFGPRVGEDPSYHDLVRGIGAVERMRSDDPQLKDVAPFTLDLFKRAAAANRRDHGDGRILLSADAYRAFLARAVTAPPGTALSDFVTLPMPVWVAGQFRTMRDPAAFARRALQLPPSAPVGTTEMTQAYWAFVKASEWFQSLPDRGTTAAVALHLPAPDSSPSRGLQLVDLATTAFAAGHDAYNLLQLAAFQLTLRGAFDPHSRYVDPSGRVVGRNWGRQRPHQTQQLDSSALVTLTQRADGSYARSGPDTAPWAGPDTDPYLVSTKDNGHGRYRVTLRGGQHVDVPRAELAELLALDPDLLRRNATTTQVVLNVSRTGGSPAPAGDPLATAPPPLAPTMPLQHAVALATGRTVWAPKGTSEVRQFPGTGHLSLTGVFDAPGTKAASDFVPVFPDFWASNATTSAAPPPPTHAGGTTPSDSAAPTAGLPYVSSDGGVTTAGPTAPDSDAEDGYVADHTDLLSEEGPPPTVAPPPRTQVESSYVRRYGALPDGSVGLVQLPAFSPEVLAGLHEQVYSELGVDPDNPPADVREQVEDRLSGAQLALNLAYVRSAGGHRVTIRVDGTDHTIDVQLTLSDPRPSTRQGLFDTRDPDKHVERRGFGTRETYSGQPSGTYRTFQAPWTGSWPIGAGTAVRAVDGAATASITHNQASDSATVTYSVQTTTSQRSNEPSDPIEFDTHWRVRRDAPNVPEAAASAARTGTPAPTSVASEGWSAPQSHGPTTIWFPRHLTAADPAPDSLPEPADLHELPLYGVDSVIDPGALYEHVHRSFRADLDDTAAEQVSTFLSEQVVRGTLPMQIDEGLHSPVITDGSGNVVGMLRLETTPVVAPAQRQSVEGQINLESHVVNYSKVSLSSKYTSGIAITGNVAAALTGDHSVGHPHSADTIGGSAGARGQAQINVSNTYGAESSSGTMHAVRTNRSHLLAPAAVGYRVTLIRPDGTESPAPVFSPKHGMDLRVLSKADAEGHRPSDEELRELPDSLEHLDGLGLSAAPLDVTGTAALYDRAEAWLRREGFLPPAPGTPAATGLGAKLKKLARDHEPEHQIRLHAQLNNLRKLRDARSRVGRRAGADSMIDGGQSLHFEIPTGTDTGVRRVRLQLTAERDTSRESRHDKVLPGIQVMGLALGVGSDSEQLGESYGGGAGPLGSVSGPLGDWGGFGFGGDYQYVHQYTDGDGVGGSTGHDQFFIGTAQDTHKFEVPVRLALDLFADDGDRPSVRFGEEVNAAAAAAATPAAPAVPTASTTSAAPAPPTVSGSMWLAVPHSRTRAPAPKPAPRPRAGHAGGVPRRPNPTDMARLEGTDATGAPLPNLVRVPDDALIDVMRGSAVIDSLFQRAAAEIRRQVRASEAAADDSGTGPILPLTTADAERTTGTGTGRQSRKWTSPLAGQGLTDTRTRAAESRYAATTPGSLIAHGHELLKNTYVVEGLTLPGALSDGQYTLELRAIAHDPELLGTDKQYTETGAGAVDTAQQSKSLGKSHQVGFTGLASQNPPAVPENDENSPELVNPEIDGTIGVTNRAGTKSFVGLFNPSARFGYTFRTDESDALSSSTAVNRVPTESGEKHRVKSGLTYVLTLRAGSRTAFNGPGELGTIDPVTFAADVPGGLEFLMTRGQHLRDARWMSSVRGLTAESAPKLTAGLPSSYTRDRELGLGTVL
ncbi:lonely Cys domain-containing protein, partial [Streptomyces sp. ECR3]|uniref:lonely Cys domain-containing protein n=1 Tax=Streptomyces sp. ECR3 TaxID=3400630 RepID=UPI003F1BE2D8